MCESFASYCARKRDEFGDKFDPSKLNKAFVPHFEAGRNRRVKVRFPYGDEAWGSVGVTTGWQPVFLLMRRRNQIGSSEIIGADCTIVAVKDMR